MKPYALVAVAALFAWTFAEPSLHAAEDMPMSHDHQSTEAATPATAAFEAANKKMHADMAIEYSGKADVDFARSMIPHHQGAIDMAKIELQYGTDPELKKLAAEVIKAQESEIAFMRDWLEKNGE